MPSKVAQLLSPASQCASLDALKHALFDEDTASGEGFNALVRLFIKVAMHGDAMALKRQAIVELRAVDTVLHALARKRDVTGLFRLACVSRVPRRPTDLSDRCLRAAIQCDDPHTLCSEAEDALEEASDPELPEPNRTAVGQAAVKAIFLLAESKFPPAYHTAASLLQSGEAGPPDPEGAAKWYRLAAIHASMEAASDLDRLAEAYEWQGELCSSAGPQFTQFWSHMVSVARDSARRVLALAPGGEIEALLEGGEEDFNYVELKSTLRWSTDDNRVMPVLEDKVAITIAGFLNTKGGSLFIGMTNQRKAYGIETDWNTFSKERDRNKDGFDRHLRQVLKNKLGPLPCLPIVIEYHPLHGHVICRVVVAPSTKPVFIGKDSDGKLYVRDGKSTMHLEEPQRTEYIKRNWGEARRPNG